MCGITGIYSASLSNESIQKLLTDMNDSLYHRGPDGDGTYITNKIGLGHRRLSIIDLAGGDQPIYNEDESVVIVFNGEIYNYCELREDLIKRGHQFKTHSDTEVIVHLYEDKGVDCLADLNGMFAFAIWDIPRQRLFIARDRLGEKPLYYSEENNRLLFASELKAIIKDKAIKRTVNIDALDDYLAYGYVPAPRTILEGIYKLPAAHYMVHENGKLSIQRYWRANFDHQNKFISAADAVGQLTELLNDSIKMRLRSDVPVGAFLSGGIDSSLIVALSAQQSPNKLSTFSVGFSAKDFDELQYAKQIAERYGTDHHEIMLTDIDPTLFPKIVAHFDEPFADPSAIPTYYVTMEAAKHLKVVLSGDGGDELFCGYGRYKAQPIEQSLRLLPQAIRGPLFNRTANLLSDHASGKGLLRRVAGSDHVHWQRTVGIFDSEERKELFRPELKKNVDEGAWLFEPFFKQLHIDQTSRRMLADQVTYMCDDILVKVDRNSMWHSLEVRVPLLDHRIVEFANSLPLDLKYHNEIQKYPLKQVLKDLVPAEILTRKKSGFAMPIKHWLKDRFYDYSRELLLSPDTRSTDFFARDRLEKLIEDNKLGKRDLSRRLWALMWFEQWYRHINSI